MRRMEIAERVQEARHDAGLSLEQLAMRSGLAYRTLRRRIEGAPGGFSLDELDSIAAATNTPFEYLISGVRPAREVA